MNWPPSIEKRVQQINSTPYAESARFVAVLKKLGDLGNEAMFAGGLSGLDDILIQIISECAAWWESRQAIRDRAALEASEGLFLERRGGKG